MHLGCVTYNVLKDWDVETIIQKLEAAGLVTGTLELSEDGKAMKYFEVTDFDLHLTASVLAEAARTLTGTERSS